MYVKFLPSQYVLRYRKGKLVSEGAGLAFFFMEQYTTACAVPVSSQDADFIFEETTKDFQKVSIQGQLTYQITDCKQATNVMDFTVNLKNKQYFDDPMQKLSKRILNIAKVLVKGIVGNMQMTEALQESRDLAVTVLQQLQKNEEIKGLGVTPTGFSVLRIAPNPETARALEASAREEILRQSDDAPT